ncbi:hypothetical protein BGU98_00840, partial [Clostridioides difficile]
MHTARISTASGPAAGRPACPAERSPAGNSAALPAPGDPGSGSDRSPGLAGQTLAVVGVVLHHHVALELQRRGEVAALLGEVVLEDRELADRLRLADRLV